MRVPSVGLSLICVSVKSSRAGRRRKVASGLLCDPDPPNGESQSRSSKPSGAFDAKNMSSLNFSAIL